MTDQNDFDAALDAYVAEVEAGVQALLAKAAGAAPATDFTAELAIISDAKANLDAALAPADPAPAAEVSDPADVPVEAVAVEPDPSEIAPADGVSGDVTPDPSV